MHHCRAIGPISALEIPAMWMGSSEVRTRAFKADFRALSRIDCPAAILPAMRGADRRSRYFLGERQGLGYRYRPAQVVELVDALDSKSSTERCVGSIPTLGTTFSNSPAPSDRRRMSPHVLRRTAPLHSEGTSRPARTVVPQAPARTLPSDSNQ